MKNLDYQKKPDNQLKKTLGKQKILRPLPIIRALFLALIMRNPRITGYEILQIVPEAINVSMKVKTGTVYTELRKLEKVGLVKSIQASEGRRKRQYEITAKGFIELKNLNIQIKTRIQSLLEPLLELIDSTITDQSKENMEKH